MNKAELIEALATYYDGNKVEASRALSAVVETITYATAAGEKVSITGFGVFEKVDRPARMVRNPRTGERTQAQETSVPRFRAGSDLKAYVAGDKKVPEPTKVKDAAAPPATKTAKTAKTAATAKTARPATKTAKTAKTAKAAQPATKTARKAKAKG